MFSLKSLRAKTLLSTLVPSFLVLAAVAVIALYAYERVTRDIVRQRDTELVRLSAAYLAKSLSRFSQPLQNVATQDDVRAMDAALLDSVLDRYQDQLYAFDGGVVVYDSAGVALASQPFDEERQGTIYPMTAEFDEIRGTLRPVFSNVTQDEVSGEEVILLGVPIIDSGNEFSGVLAGIATIRYSALGETYTEALELTRGGEPFAYLVDGSGRIIHHRYGTQLGRDLGVTVPVVRATRGETGAVITEDLSGETVISGFAPVPGTGWAVITQQRWESVVGSIRGYNRLLLSLLVVGGVLSAVLIFSAIGRILKPIKGLTQGAQRIAGGDFDHTITTKTGDEIQALADQFNTMADALKESHADLEQRVADRTKELRESEERVRTVVTGAPVVLFAVDRDGIFTLSEGQGLDALGLKPGQMVGQSAFEVYQDTPEIVDHLYRSLEGEEVASTVQVADLVYETRYSPVRDEDGEVVGVIGVATDVTDRQRAEEELRDAHRRLIDIIEFLPDATFVIDHEEKVIAWNRAIEEMTGIRKQDIIGQGDFAYAVPFYGMRRPLLVNLIGMEHADMEPHYDYVERRGNALFAEVFLPSLRGGVGAHVRVTASPLLDREGNRYGAIESIRDITERKRAEEGQLQQTRELAVLEERNRMAREIHDTLAQGFTGIILQLEAAEQAVSENSIEVSSHLDRAKALGRESLREARRSVWDLLPQALEHHPIEVALEEAVQRFAVASSTNASFSQSGSKRALSTDIQTALLRICQEALNNVSKHAKATEVKVNLSFSSDSVSISIQDDGVGFDGGSVRGADRRGGFGLIGMKQRARLLGSELEAESNSGKGTVVKARIPTQ